MGNKNFTHLRQEEHLEINITQMYNNSNKHEKMEDTMKSLTLLVCAMVGLMLTVNALAKTIVTDGLVSYWTFDQGTIIGNKVKDVWGENHATTVGSPKRVDGYVKEGLELDGNGEYVSLPNVGNFGKQIGDYTFEVWFKTTNRNRWSAIYRVLEKSCAKFDNGTGVIINGSFERGDRDLEVLTNIRKNPDWFIVERSRIRKNGCGSSTSGRVKPVSDGKWHQFVYTTKAASKEDIEELNANRPAHFPALRFEDGGCFENRTYIDTESPGDGISCSSPPNFLPFVEPIFLGAVNNMGDASGFFEGVFDEVRIYDRALTEEEVIHNFKSGIGLNVEATEKLPTVWGALKKKR